MFGFAGDASSCSFDEEITSTLEKSNTSGPGTRAVWDGRVGRIDDREIPSF
jgi:hypothetical protein